jgi:6-pyruvoyltetrahydropterin/6-carboxytetrahydropterin synthase
MSYRVNKHYPHSLGLSCAFRQWKAASHCRFIHGYSLSFDLEFGADTLDHRNWVIDFGDLKPIKKWLEETFDHRLAVAEDDPEIGTIQALHAKGIANVLLLPRVGCESFAEHTGKFVRRYLHHAGLAPRVHLLKVTCAEHQANSASWLDD